MRSISLGSSPASARVAQRTPVAMGLRPSPQRKVWRKPRRCSTTSDRDVRDARELVDVDAHVGELRGDAGDADGRPVAHAANSTALECHQLAGERVGRAAGGEEVLHESVVERGLLVEEQVAAAAEHDGRADAVERVVAHVVERGERVGVAGQEQAPGRREPRVDAWSVPSRSRRCPGTAARRSRRRERSGRASEPSPRDSARAPSRGTRRSRTSASTRGSRSGVRCPRRARGRWPRARGRRSTDLGAGAPASRRPRTCRSAPARCAAARRARRSPARCRPRVRGRRRARRAGAARRGRAPPA